MNINATTTTKCVLATLHTFINICINDSVMVVCEKWVFKTTKEMTTKKYRISLNASTIMYKHTHIYLRINIVTYNKH